MKIEIKRIHRIDGGTTLRAFADVCLNDSVLIKGVRIVDGKRGLFISLPSEKAKDNKWYESVQITDINIKEQLQDAVIKAYNDEVNNAR